MKKIILLLLLTQSYLLLGQNLSKIETINYINKNLTNTQIQIDNQGIINISGIGIFHYNDVVLDQYPFYKFQIRFNCKTNNECIEDPKYKPGYEYPKSKYTNSVTIFLEDKEQFKRLYNAFDYLLKLLQKENLKKDNSDPFSPENYKRN